MADRIEHELRHLGQEHEPPAGWEARVLAVVSPRRTRWPFVALLAVTVVALSLAVVMWRRAAHAEARLLEMTRDLDYCTSLLPSDGRWCVQTRGACRGDSRL